jgi:hypothetical protein
VRCGIEKLGRFSDSGWFSDKIHRESPDRFKEKRRAEWTFFYFLSDLQRLDMLAL